MITNPMPRPDDHELMKVMRYAFELQLEHDAESVKNWRKIERYCDELSHSEKLSAEQRELAKKRAKWARRRAEELEDVSGLPSLLIEKK